MQGVPTNLGSKIGQCVSVYQKIKDILDDILKVDLQLMSSREERQSFQ